MSAATFLNGPAPAFFQCTNVAMPLADFDRVVERWLADRLPPECGRVSYDEIEFLCQNEPALEDVMHTMRLLKPMRAALRAQQVRGFSAVFDAFQLARKQYGQDIGRIVLSLHQDFGGVLVGGPGSWVLALPSPFGEWSVCDGWRLERRESNPLRSA